MIVINYKKMFRSSKIAKLAFFILGAVVLMSGQAEAARMRPNTLSQQITPGVSDSTNVEKGGRPVPNATVAAGTVSANASTGRSCRKDYESDDSDSDDEDGFGSGRRRHYPKRSRSKSNCGCKAEAVPLQGTNNNGGSGKGSCSVPEEKPDLTQPTKNPDGTVSVSVGSYENYSRYDSTNTNFNFPTLDDYENSALGARYRRKHHRLGRCRRDDSTESEKSCGPCKKVQQRPPVFAGATPK